MNKRKSLSYINDKPLEYMAGIKQMRILSLPTKMKAMLDKLFRFEYYYSK